MKQSKLFIKLIFLFIIYNVSFASINTIEAKTEVSNDNPCPAPIISNFSPASGPENTIVTINGSNFTDASTVTFDGVIASFSIINDNQITAFASSSLNPSATISITSSGGCIGNSITDFTFITPNCSDTSEIYISELYDSELGSFGVVELYNPTTATISLDGVYEVQRFGDIGNPTPSVSIPLAGSIPPTSTYIIEMGSTGSICNGLSPNMTLAAGFNANDELKLLKNNIVIDVVEAPDETGYSIIRNPDSPAPNNTYIATEWDTILNESCANLRSHTADPNVVTIPVITQPNWQTICENGNAVFTVSVATGTYTYQWKILNSSGAWVNVVDNVTYSGANTNTLTLNNVPISFDNNQYYCEITSATCNLVTDATHLFISNPYVDTIPNQIVCTSYTLPTLTNGNYFTGTNGTGTPLFVGEVISTSQTIYIFNESGTAPNICFNESSFMVTITGIPPVDTLADYSDCSSYTLPTLTNGNYFTASNGTGTMLNAGESISTTQTIFIYNEIGTTPNTCSNESSFTVTISGAPPVDTIANQNVCTDYTLPALTNGNYFTGTNGTGTALFTGQVITTNQTIFIYNESGMAPNICSNETNFTITIIGIPPVDILTNQTDCNEYILPTLTNGNYFTATNGTGTMLNAGETISTTQTIFIYNEIGTTPNTCSNESSFMVTISGTPPVDAMTNQNVCSNYTLPTLTNGNYYTGTNGTGTPLFAGDVISTTQTIFIYDESGIAPNICTNESSFTVTIIGIPPVDILTNQTDCTEYILPTLTNGNYFTASNGTGTMLNAGESISTTQTIFIYNEIGTAPNNCSNESSFMVTISGTPPVDAMTNQNVCSNYTLPTLTNGNYYTGTNGTGTPLFAGDVISTTQTIFIYDESGIAPNICTNESSFTVTIIGIPPVDVLPNQTDCTEYILPILTNGNYFTATNGTGTMLNAGESISTTQTIFIYNEIGTAPNNCSNESIFNVTILGQPNVDIIDDQEICSEYILPTLTNGNYFTASNGTGTPLFAGETISTTQTIFIYNESGTAPNICFNESSFMVTIFPEADFTLTENNLEINENTLTVTMTDTSISYEYAIDNESFQTSPFFNGLSNGSHILYVQDENGCIVKSIPFEIETTNTIHIPPFFTPNNDGQNDVWQITDTQNTIKEIYVYDRYGKLLKQIPLQSKSWDGLYRGYPKESNDYWYLITLRTGKQLNGHFTLKR